MSIIPTTRSAARTPGPAEGSCVSSSATRSELLLSADYGRFDGVPLTYAKPIAAKTEFADSGLTFRQPRQPVGGAHQPPGIRGEHSARRLGQADTPSERHDDAEQPDGVPKIQLSLLHRRRRHRTDVADVRRARPPAPVLAGADDRAAHAEGHLDRRRVPLRRPQRRAGRDHRIIPSPLRFGHSRRSGRMPERCSARLLSACRAAFR